MNLPKLKSRLGRTALVAGLTGVMLGGVGMAAAQAAGVGSLPGAVSLNPLTGPTSSSPGWQTTVGCNSGFQGSAVFKLIIQGAPQGQNTFSISGGTNSVVNAFSGTLALPLSTIQSLSAVPNGGTGELVVYCFSGASQTGTSDPEMSTFVTYSADGLTYTSSGNNPVPVGEIGGIVFAGLAAVGLFWMQLRRRSRRTQPA